MRFFSWLFRRGNNAAIPPARVFLSNTLTGNKELFVSQKPGIALMYTCGPTVYGPAHIGNLRAYVFSDTLARTLVAAHFRVNRVINITDFGHLVSDGDEGEDKMTKGLKREKLPITLENMRMLADRYTKGFLADLEVLNIDVGSVRFPRASDFIEEQIAMIATLEQKGYAYRTKRGVYYDTSRFPNYGKLGAVNLAAQREGARAEKNPEKRNPADFVLWKPDTKLGWQSPWGLGFPGWHIECSAMSRSLLGQEIDIHTGGEDHIAVHHNNEIAQSEAASGRTFVHYWLHNAFLTIGGEKASKSAGNVDYLSDVTAKGYHPLALRYFYLQAHYRTPLSFSFEALAAAAGALERLWKHSRELREESHASASPSEARERFILAMRDDLATPQALGILWESLRNDDLEPEEKWGLLEEADAHLGLELLSPPKVGEVAHDDIPAVVQGILEERARARETKDYATSDRLRAEIERQGYTVRDENAGQVLTRTSL